MKIKINNLTDEQRKGLEDLGLLPKETSTVDAEIVKLRAQVEAYEKMLESNAIKNGEEREDDGLIEIEGISS